MKFLYKRKWLKVINRILLAGWLLVIVLGNTGCDRRGQEVAAMEGDADGQEEQAVEYVYGIPMDKNAGVITASVADVYIRPDVKSNRISQALYNQPVSILLNENGWAHVITVDGTSGWMKTKYIGNDVSSIFGRIYTHKIIVTSREKTITLGPAGGSSQMEAPMGTELYAFNNFDDAYEVFLPENKTGWLKGSGIIHIQLDEVVPVTNAEDFASTAARLKGVSYLLNGMSSMGIDAPGLVYICARINGINLPRTIKGQLAVGTEISPEDAKAGDLVFLAGTGEDEGDDITCVGICVGGGSYLYAGRKVGYVALGEINRENSDGVVVAARRIFN